MDEATEAISFERLANRLTFNPNNNKLYSAWNFLISLISLFQTILYAILVGWGHIHNTFDYQSISLGVVELIYLINIIIQFFIAYDEQGDGIYEFRFEKTAKRFMRRSKFYI